MYAWASFSMKFSCGQHLAVRKTPPPSDSLCGFALGFHEEARTSRPPTASGKMLNTLNITKFLCRGSIFRTGGFCRGQHLPRRFALASEPFPPRSIAIWIKPEGPSESRISVRQEKWAEEDAEVFATEFCCRTVPSDSPASLFRVHDWRSLPVLVTNLAEPLRIAHHNGLAAGQNKTLFSPS